MAHSPKNRLAILRIYSVQRQVKSGAKFKFLQAGNAMGKTKNIGSYAEPDTARCAEQEPRSGLAKGGSRECLHSLSQRLALLACEVKGVKSRSRDKLAEIY